MTQFRVLPQRELCEQHFEEFPVWSEHYDFEEIEDIERWGLDRDEVLRLFQEHERGSEHCVDTLLEANPFPPRMRIFIKAALELSSGQKFKGFVMNEDAFCLSIFCNGKAFQFTRHPMLEGLNKEHEQRLLHELGSSTANVFPIRYTTEYKNSIGEPISGTFNYGQSLKS